MIFGMLGILVVTILLVLLFVLTAFAYPRTIYVIPAPNDTLQPIETPSPTIDQTPEPTLTIEPTGIPEPTATKGLGGIGIPTMSRTVRTVRPTSSPT